MTTQDNEAIATYLATVEAELRAALAAHPTITAAELIAEVQSYTGPADGDSLATMEDHASCVANYKAREAGRVARRAAMTQEERDAFDARVAALTPAEIMERQLASLAKSVASVVEEFSPANYQR